jgi:hypothetical protein
MTFGRIKAIGAGSNKVKRERAAKVALFLALNAFESVCVRDNNAEANDVLMRLLSEARAALSHVHREELDVGTDDPRGGSTCQLAGVPTQPVSLVSLGTVGHPLCCGEACIAASRGGCSDGAWCDHCHICLSESSNKTPLRSINAATRAHVNGAMLGCYKRLKGGHP